MDKEKAIEEMTEAVMCAIKYRERIGTPNFELMAKNLINAGYGNVAQAVKEFAEELKAKLNAQREIYLYEYEYDSASTMRECAEMVDDLIKERFPNDTV